MANNVDRKKVLLVSLPNPTMTDQAIAPPLGLLYLASAIQDIADVTILDLGINKLHPSFWEDYDIVGVSVATSNYYIYHELAATFNLWHPGTLLVAGGPHVTAKAQEVLENTPTDICIAGEGENVLKGIITMFPHLKRGIRSDSLIKDLDTIKFPARELLDFSRYTRTIQGKPATNIITSRGCCGECIFCNQQAWQHKLRMHSAEYVLMEVDDIKAKTGIDRLLFLDDTLTINKKRLLKICAGLKERKVIWRGWTRSDQINGSLLYTMKDSGCHSICFGIESGSQKVLDAMKKGITITQNQKAIRLAKNIGLNVRVSVMVGNPKETLEDVMLTELFMATNADYIDDYILSTFVPVVGSESFDKAEDYGIILDKKEITDKLYQNYFVVGYDEKTGLVMHYKDKSKEEIISHRNRLEEFLRKHIGHNVERVVK